MPKSKEQCEEIREQMKERIINGALICFARNGLAGTKVSDLAKHIGIGQGTLYNYFRSKEEVFHSITETLGSQNDRSFQLFLESPIPVKDKILRLSESLMQQIQEQTQTAYELVLNYRMVEEGGLENPFTQSYGSMPTKVLSELVSQGQSEGTVVPGDPLRLAEFYWNVVHGLAFAKVIHKDNNEIPAKWLARILLLDEGG